MAVSSPVDSSIARSVPRRRGPVPNESVEARTPLGRQLHALEGVAFTGSQQAIYYRGDRDLRLAHDSQADAHVFEIERAALTLLEMPDLAAEIRDLAYSILANVRGYQRADAAEDAAAVNGDGRVESMHGGFKRVAGWCERLCVAIREQARKGLGR